MQHLSLEIFAQPGAQLSAPDAITVFHRWIQQRSLPEVLIDVADYAHLPAGPGVVLMGHEAAYSLDTTRHRLGLLYNRREPVSLDDQASLQQVYDAALLACRKLEGEPEFRGKLTFDGHEFAIVWNDRLLYPNADETWERVRPTVEAFLASQFSHYKVTRTHNDARERLRADVRV